jgi:hypothetical protein
VKELAAALLCATWALTARRAEAGLADVTAATAQCTATTCAVSATVRHADEGWQHYADRYEVLAPDGHVLGTRVLQHPHVEEQPVTRTLEGLMIPSSVDRVRIRAHDSVHGFGGAEVDVVVERPQH